MNDVKSRAVTDLYKKVRTEEANVVLEALKKLSKIDINKIEKELNDDRFYENDILRAKEIITRAATEVERLNEFGEPLFQLIHFSDEVNFHERVIRHCKGGVYER